MGALIPISTSKQPLSQFHPDPYFIPGIQINRIFNIDIGRSIYCSNLLVSLAQKTQPKIHPQPYLIQTLVSPWSRFHPHAHCILTLILWLFKLNNHKMSVRVQWGWGWNQDQGETRFRVKLGSGRNYGKGPRWDGFWGGFSGPGDTNQYIVKWGASSRC